MPLLRWLLCCALTGGLLVPGGAALASADLFADDDGTAYEDAIEALARRDIVAGCSDEEYCPTEPVRRGQAASLLSRAFDVPATDRDHFADDDGTVHEDAINRLAAAGISVGCSETEYCVGDRLDRGQMATLLVRAAEVPATDDTYFRDVGGVHRRAVNRLAAAGVTAGCSKTSARFCPDREVQRGEMAIFLARALDLARRAELQPLRTRSAPPKERPRKKRRFVVPGVWARLAACESGGNWSINTGNGYYGGLQFSLGSWRAVGGSGYPHEASKKEQIKRGRKLRARQGWGAWPACSSKLGLR